MATVVVLDVCVKTGCNEGEQSVRDVAYPPTPCRAFMHWPWLMTISLLAGTEHPLPLTAAEKKVRVGAGIDLFHKNRLLPASYEV